MSDSSLVLVGAVALFVIIGLATLIRWKRTRSARVVLQGLGAALLVAGLWVIGVLDLVLQWIRETVHWAEQTTFDLLRQVGLGVLALGLVLAIIGFAMSPVSREEAKNRRQAAASKKGATKKNAAGSAKAATAKSGPAVVAPGPVATPDSEDAEVEELLRKRGIE